MRKNDTEGETPMKIAVMSDRPDIQGRVPARFEDAAALLVVETDNDSLCSVTAGETPERYAALVAASGCEAVVSGGRIGKDCFEPIADACVTRYDGTGLDVLTAAKRAERGTLDIVPDYEGGHGCGSNGGSCDCGHDH